MEVDEMTPAFFSKDKELNMKIKAGTRVLETKVQIDVAKRRRYQHKVFP